MKQAVLRGGILGCGAVVYTAHMPYWRTIKDVEIVAVCDQRSEAANELAKRWGIPGVYTELSQMLHNENLDFVDICTPPQTHCLLAIQSMEAGLHVLVEKPMAENLSEADRMVAASRQHNVKLCVIHNLLFSPVIQKARALMDNGSIGELLSLDIHSLEISERYLSRQNHWSHSLPGGTFGECAPHMAYLIQSFFNNIISIHTVTRKHSQFSWVTADELKVLIEADNGLGTFTVSFNSPRDILTVDIFGTKRNIHIDNFAQTIIHRKPRSVRINDLILDRLDLIIPILNAGVSGIINQLKHQKRNRLGHKIIMQKFVTCLRNDTDPPVTGEDGRKTVKLLEEILGKIS